MYSRALYVGNVGALYQIYRESADAQATTYDAVQGTGYGYIGYDLSSLFSSPYTNLLIARSIVQHQTLASMKRIRREYITFLHRSSVHTSDSRL